MVLGIDQLSGLRAHLATKVLIFKFATFLAVCNIRYQVGFIIHIIAVEKPIEISAYVFQFSRILID